MATDLEVIGIEWQRIEQAWTAWWAGDLDRPLVTVQCLDPGAKAALDDTAPYFASSLPLSMPAEEVIGRYQAKLEALHYYGDAFPHWWPDFGPGIIAGFLGTQVRPRADTVWFEPALRGSIRDLRLQYDPDNLWLRRLRILTQEAVSRWGKGVAVGHTDLGGNLDILASLVTTSQLLTDLHDAPEDVERLVGAITHLWIQYYDQFYDLVKPNGRGTINWAHVWSPGRTYMLQCDFAFMISPQMFERFVLPDLQMCCAALDHPFFHFHFDSFRQEPQLEILLAMEQLRGIQWAFVEGWQDPSKYLPVLKRIRDAGKLCQPWGVTPSAALTIVRELGGRGFLLTFDEDSALKPGEADEFLQVLAAEGGFHWSYQ